MKQTKKTILLASAFLCLNLSSFSQSVSLSLKNVTVEQAMKELKESSGYTFVFSSVDVDTNQRVNVSANNTPINEVVGQILNGQRGITYEIEGKNIVIRKNTGKTTAGQQQVSKKVQGRILDDKGEPVYGAAIRVQGSTARAISDLEGNFTIEAPENALLEITYIGYNSQIVRVESDKPLSISLSEDTKTLNEVVVTALGIKRSEKALSYNAQQVRTDELTTNKDANFVNALSGKVAGVNINSSSSGVGGVSKVVMRGTKSIMQSSNALYVIDGVPMFARRGTGGGTEFDSQGSSEPIADINPEDIESMTVLTGAAAAALYGSEAANGAVVITTKSGRAGKISITVSQNTEFTSPFVMPKFQNRYGTGTDGVLSVDGARSWGSKLVSANSYGYSPADDYFQTGVNSTESVSLSTGTEKNQTYASASALNSKGIVPNNKYERYNFTVRNTTSFLQDKMKLDVGASYILQKDRNMTNQGIYNNPLVGAYLFPRGNDWSDISMYERWDPARKLYTQYWPVGDQGMTMQNPYWINYRNLRENKKDRYMLNASLSYQVLPWLSVSGRVRLDNATTDYTEKFYASTNTQLTEQSSRGLYTINRINDKQLYADFLVNINKTFGTDWTLQANFGGSFSDIRSDGLEVRGPIADGSDAFSGETVGLPNFFAVQNLSPSKTRSVQEGWREQTQSLFASAEVGYKSTYYLTLTGRNDWPSQLAGPNSNSSCFFYPSVGGSMILSELIPNLNKNILSFIKLRASYASVGSAFSRYLSNPHYSWNSSAGQWSNQLQYPLYNLKPERTDSWEVGLNLRFLKDFTLDVTYYNAKTKNQTFNPQLPVSGWASMYIQTGAVRNQGVELAIGFKHTWGKFTWDTGLTYSMNRNKIVELAENAVNPVTGENFSISTLDMGGLGEARFLLKKGGTMGDLYSLVDLKRDNNGKIYVDQDGNISAETITDPDKYIKLGSVLPDGNLSWRNSFSYKNFNIGFQISARFGGIVYSRTQAMLDYYGVSEATATARDNGYVMINGNDRVMPETWYSTIASGTSVPQYYTYSATNVRLQEVSLGYTFPRRMLANICDITLSVVGRNLLMIYNKAPFDPESIASTDNFYQGIDYFMMPALRNMGFSLRFKF